MTKTKTTLRQRQRFRYRARLRIREMFRGRPHPKCAYCGRFPYRVTLNHVEPLSKGGSPGSRD